jgi:threonine/homoserine/homoserine lactone efflux protein
MTEPMLFALTTAALLAMPGPTNALLLTAGAADGPRSLRLIPAEIAGYLVAILTIAYLVGPLVSDVWALGLLLRLGAALYLVTLAVRLWRRGARSDCNLVVTRRDVFVTTLLNPKAVLLGLGIVPVQGANGGAYLAAFCLLVATIGAAWIVVGLAIRCGLLSTMAASVLPRIGATIVAAFASYLVVGPLM